MDNIEDQEKIVKYVELLATYINPEVMNRVFDARMVQEQLRSVKTPVNEVSYSRDQEPAPSRVITLGGISFSQINYDFDKNMRELQRTGKVTVKDDNPRIPFLRAELERAGKPVPSIRAMLRKQGVDLDSIVGDGSSGS